MGSLHYFGFLQTYGSLLDDRFLPSCGTLVLVGFLFSCGSLYLFGFLLNSGSLLVFGFLPLSCSLKYSVLIYACGLCRSSFDVFHVERQDTWERRTYTVFSELNSPLYPEEGRLIFDPIPPPLCICPGREQHKDKIVVVLS